MRFPFAVALSAMLLAASPAAAQLATVELPSLRLVYFDGTESYLVPHVERTFLNALEFDRRVLGYKPEQKITVLLADFEDYGNAGASVVPRNALQIQVAPLSFAFETIAANERMNTIMNHELVHVVTMDQATRRDRTFRTLFGGKVNPIAEQPESILYFFLTTPRVAAPRWYHEGIAVFMDTWMAGGMGRAQGGYDEMVFRAMVRDGAHFYDPLGLASEGTKVDFQLQINSYLYGTRFMTWLAQRYSPEQVVAWVTRQPGSRGYYASQFRNVFGTSLESAWTQWVASEHEFQRKNLAAIREHPVTPYRDLSTRALGSVSRAFYDERSGKIYAAFNYPGVVAHVGSISVEGGQTERLVDIKGPVIYTVTSLAYDSAQQQLFYTTDNNAHRDLVVLDPATKQTRLLLKDARIGDLAFNRADRSLWGIRQLNGLSTLVRLEPPYRQWSRVVTWPYGTIVYDLDISPDGTRLSASFGEITGKQDVRVIPIAALMKGDTTPSGRFDFGTSVPSGFVFSHDGRYLYGSSYFTGVSNIFRYELSTGDIEAVSNTETGFFRPIPLAAGDGLIVFRYTGAGFVATRIAGTPVKDASAITFLGERLAETHPVVKQWMLGSPADVPLDAVPAKSGVYRLAGGLKRESFYPVVQGYKDTAAAGVRANFSDPLQLNRLNLTATFSPSGDLPAHERTHLAAEYQRFDWHARVALNRADFYDLFGPTKTSRKGYFADLAYIRTLLYDQPRRIELALSGGLAGNIDRLPDYQNVPVDIDHMWRTDARLSGTNVRSSLGHVDDEKGRTWAVTYQGSVVAGEYFPRAMAQWDMGVPVGPGHSSVWLRSSAGLSAGHREDPNANFFFGGFGNNWVDRGPEKRYREYYSFPGTELNEIGGRNFVRSTLEWNLPPLRFERAGTPGMYLTWARPAIFVGGLATNLDANGARRTAADLGGQLDFRLTALSTLDMTVSVGAAVALEQGSAPLRELMVSLKVLK